MPSLLHNDVRSDRLSEGSEQSNECMKVLIACVLKFINCTCRATENSSCKASDNWGVISREKIAEGK